MSYERDKIIGLLARLFEAEDWRWIHKNGKYTIPSYDEIKDTIDDLENTAYKENIVETGRIRVEYDKKTQTYEYYLHL